ncbi:flagella basal body P-ring formation protein FlgA, partial [Methylorubrum extorquens DSM 13060]
MHALRPIRRPVPLAVTPLSRGMIGRTVLALAAFLTVTLFTLPLMAAGTTLRLRGDVTARGDTLSFGDLVEGAPADLAARALFRAPALGLPRHTGDR